MLREAFTDRLKQAMKARGCAHRFDRAADPGGAEGTRRRRARRGQSRGIAEPDILRMLQGMIKQRRESIALYEQGNRPDLAQQESEEIGVIESFLPRQMSEDEIAAAAQAVIAETGAAGIRTWARSWRRCASATPAPSISAAPAPIVKRLLG